MEEYSKKRIFNVASYNRPENLVATIDSIYDQADVINICLNSYDHVPKQLYRDKINIILSDNSYGDAMKFSALKDSDGYYFTIDDDIIYPKDYAEVMIRKVEKFERRCIISVHGRSFSKFPIISYYRSATDKIHCLRNNGDNVEVQFGGTGVMCFHTDLFKLDITYFKLKNMADIWIGKYAMDNNIKIIGIKHEAKWLRHQIVQTSIFDETKNKDKIQTEIVNIIFSNSSKRLKNQRIENVIKNCEEKIKKIKLGVAYSVFDDLEHLELSIRSIRDNVDFITVIYQNVSYRGNNVSYNVYIFLSKLLENNLIDNIQEYRPNLNIKPKENEVIKRNLGLRICIENECTHHITMDGDEIYVPAQFKKAKEIVYDYQYEASFVLSRTYYKSKSYYINPPEQYHIPFIYKISDRKFEYKAKINLVSADSSRVMNNVTEDIMIFERQFIEMHHLCYVRKDLKRKLQNKASNLSEERIEKILNSYDNFKLLQLTQEVYTENGTFNVRLHLFPAI